MICDVCGKNNCTDADRCSFCGADMPKKCSCSGFSDILSYDRNNGLINKKENETSKEKMLILLKKMGEMKKMAQKQILFGAVSVVLGVCVLVSSIVTGYVITRSAQDNANKISSEFEKVRIEVAEYLNQVDEQVQMYERKTNGD